MTDPSLLRELELFQELSESEVEAVFGGANQAQTQQIAPIGLSPSDGCPACISGLDGSVLKEPYLEVIKPV